MHDGVIPGTNTANVITRIPNETTRDDTKSENRRKAPKKRGPKTSFADWLRFRARAEEEELEHLDDEELDDEELDDEEYPEPDEDEDGPSYDEEDDGDPEEFDDFDEEKELEFDDDDERAPFPIPKRHDVEDDERAPFPIQKRNGLESDDEEPMPGGRFSDFYRMSGEEEQEDSPGGFEPGQAVGTASAMGQNVSKKDKARAVMRQLASKPGITRDEMIQELIRQLPTTDSTATSYYEDIAREMGLMGNAGDEDMGQEPGMGDEGPVSELPGDNEQQLSQEEIDAQDPNAQGIIRTVDKAHMVYKRQMEDGKFEELWVYNLGDELDDALNVRREILGGTDIPRGHTRSEDGQQTYTLHTMGNAQLLHITGLAN